MSRMHSGAKGKHGSKKPVSAAPPSWITHKPEEVEALVLKLAKQGMSSSMIGLVLRDSYGVPDVEKIIKKKITKLLKEKELGSTIPEDLQNLIKRSIIIRKHLESHKKDMSSKRGLQLTEAKILRLIKYYKREGMLPTGWKYEPEKAGLLAK